MELNISRMARAALSLSVVPSGEAPTTSLLDWPLTVKNKDYLSAAELCSAGRVRDPSPHESSPHEPLCGHPGRQASQRFNCLANHLAGQIIRDFHLADRLRQNKMDHSAPGFFIREDKPKNAAAAHLDFWQRPEVKHRIAD